MGFLLKKLFRSSSPFRLTALNNRFVCIDCCFLDRKVVDLMSITRNQNLEPLPKMVSKWIPPPYYLLSFESYKLISFEMSSPIPKELRPLSFLLLRSLLRNLSSLITSDESIPDPVSSMQISIYLVSLKNSSLNSILISPFSVNFYAFEIRLFKIWLILWESDSKVKFSPTN
jgi:hypothetical protein